MGRNKRIESKKQIIDAAFEIMDSEGDSALTIRRISSELGVSSMTPYNYIQDTKEIRREILIRCFNIIYQKIYTKLNELVSNTNDGELEAYARAYACAMYDFAAEHREICSYLIGEGKRTFQKDAELGPFYDPFGVYLAGHGHTAETDMYKILHSFECVVLSLLYEHTCLLRNISYEEYMQTIELFIGRMFLF